MKQWENMIGCPVADAIQTINKFLVGVDCVWGQGYGFDMTILENL